MKNLEPDLFAAARLPPRKVPTRMRFGKVLGVTLGGVVVVAAGVHFFGDAVLNRFVRPRLEASCAAHLAGSSLTLGSLHYDFLHNRLRCEGVEMTLPHGSRATVGSLSVQGVHWMPLLAGKCDMQQLASRARIEMTEISAVLPSGEYRVRCAQLRISVPDSLVAATTLSVRPLMSDEAFFAADAFRRARYRLDAASCTLRGVGFAELLSGQAYRAESVELAAPVWESLADQEKPRRPPTAGSPWPQEALAAIEKPLRINHLTITDGLFKYAGRRSVEADPGVLTFTAVQISGRDIANVAAGGEGIGLLAEGRLMDAGKLTVEMRIPVTPSALTFHYSGKLDAMDLTRLDEYMTGAGRIQIKSGRADEASFDIDVVDGHARGVLRGAYRDLQIRVVDRETGSEKSVTNRVATVLANHLKVKEANVPDKAGALKEGKVDYTRKPEESFLQFAWLALRSGIMDLISL